MCIGRRAPGAPGRIGHMSRDLIIVGYLLLMGAIIVVCDILFFRDLLWWRLGFNVAVVAIFAIVYMVFLRGVLK
jgi:hypothetical protein